MLRRQFLVKSGAVCTIGSIIPYATRIDGAALINNSNTDFNDKLNRLIELNDQRLPQYLANQELDRQDPFYGGILDGYGIHTPQRARAFLEAGCCSITWSQSQYFQSEDLLKKLEIAGDYLLNVQHDDGTIDLLSTNFHSTPDTGFMVKRLTPIVVILERNNWPELFNLKDKLKSFIIRAGGALTVGGIHTPNHRWVVCAALAWVNRLSPDQKYVTRIDEWLSEGIDIDPDGQFNEKSTSVYSPVTDRVFVMMARLLNRPELLEPVRKNLEMTMYYVHPNGEVATEASGRQDKYRRATMHPYYYPYRYMALKDGNPKFAAMCRLIESTAFERLTSYLNYLIEDESLQADLPDVGEIPLNYERAFIHSGVYRIRRDKLDATIISDNATFFTFHKGNAALQALRLATAFFGKGQFKAQQIEQVDGTYILSATLKGPYFQPFPADKIPSDGDWRKMPRGYRMQSEIQSLSYQIRITEKTSAFRIEIDIEGTDRVPVAIELGFRNGGVVEGVQPVTGIDNAFLMTSEEGEYRLENDLIKFTGRAFEHQWTQLRGALPKLDLMSVYITGLTPFHQVIEVG